MLGKLTDTAVRNAKPKDKPYKLSDAGGMYLLVTPKGGRWWRFDFRVHGKRKTLSLGVYPDVKLKKARKRRDCAREQIAEGLDPSDIRKEEKVTREGADTFKNVAKEWLGKHKPNWAVTHTEKIESRLENDVFPYLGDSPIDTITARHMLEVLQRVESRGALETAHRIRQHCSAVFRYAIATGLATRDVTLDLRGALPTARPRHHGSITEPKKVGALMRAIDGYVGQQVTRCALLFSALVFARPGELRQAEWEEIDFDNAEWRIPAVKMKMARVHIVPLSAQALEVLKELQPLTGKGRYLFPSIRSKGRPMSENTVGAALKAMGYMGDEMTAHGFRGMAATRLNEMGWNRDAIERQLAHIETNSVRAAYVHAEYLDERVRMMQAWADYLDSLKTGARVTAIGTKRSA